MIVQLSTLESKAKQSKMSLYKSPELSKNKPFRKRTSSASQTLLSLYLGPKIPIGLFLEEFTPQVIKEEEERRGKVKQAKKDEKERLEREKRENREKEIAGFRKFSSGYKIPSRN
jgi:hypothetical protein